MPNDLIKQYSKNTLTHRNFSHDKSHGYSTLGEINMKGIITAILASSATSGLLIWITKEWISTRLKLSIQHEYDQKLEAHKAILKASNETTLVEFKSKLENEANTRALAVSAFSVGQRATIERRLNSVDRLWEKILDIRKESPPVLAMVDVMTVKEYTNAKGDNTFMQLMDGYNEQNIIRMAEEKEGHSESLRLYTGEYLWALFYAYRAINIRIVLLLYYGQTDEQKLKWHEDEMIRGLLSNIITKAELSAFDAEASGKVSWIRNKIETKFLNTAQNIISGKEFSSDMLTQASLIEIEADKIFNKLKDKKEPNKSVVTTPDAARPTS